MKWHYSGQMAIHSEQGWQHEQVSGIFELPDRNVQMIRDFLYANRDFILSYKHNPPSGEAPWGDVQSQIQMRSTLNQRLSDDEWGAGVDKQTKAYLVAFYHHMLENIDLYSPTNQPDKAIAA
jgi:hypothetical protein